MHCNGTEGNQQQWNSRATRNRPRQEVYRAHATDTHTVRKNLQALGPTIGKSQGSDIRHYPQYLFLPLNWWLRSCFLPPHSFSIKKYKMLATHGPMLTVLVHFTQRTQSSCLRPTAQHHVQPLEWDLQMRGRQTPLPAKAPAGQLAVKEFKKYNKCSTRIKCCRQSSPLHFPHSFQTGLEHHLWIHLQQGVWRT